MISAYQLGATLYIPATRDDLADILSLRKYPDLRSVVICLEDSVPSHQISLALKNLQHFCTNRDQQKSALPLIFIRPRHIEMASYLINHFNLSYATGFVLPKFDLDSAMQWHNILANTDLQIMPTLETAACFEPDKMNNLATNLLSTPYFAQSIIALRVGGNDLLRILGLRRPKTGTLYDTPLGYVIKMLTCQFRPQGFSLTAPVCELIEQPDILQAELAQDIQHGFVGKTAIHPLQIDQIHNAYQVDPVLYHEAEQILKSQQAVFKLNGAMCEPATHMAWAQQILMQAEANGIRPSENIEKIHTIR